MPPLKRRAFDSPGAKAAADKEKRVEHLTQMAAKRMGKKELSMGFESWAELWSEYVRGRNLLRPEQLSHVPYAHAHLCACEHA